MNRPLESNLVGGSGILTTLLGLLITPIALTALGIDLQSTAAQAISWSSGIVLAVVGVLVFVLRQSLSMRRMLGALAYALFLLVVTELLLQFAAAINPRWDFILSELQPIVPDAKLLDRPSPLHPEHDSNGFRNEAVPTLVNIVALGDSQTYGDNASRRDAWPQHLAELLQQPTYNMGVGGYSPPQALGLIDEAIALRPKTIVFALYSGNDVQEAFWRVYLDQIMPSLAVEDLTLKATLLDQERNSPSSYAKIDFGEQEGRILKLPGLLRAMLRVLIAKLENEDQHWGRYVTQAETRGEFVLDVPNYRTIFTQEKRLHALDLRDIRLQEGYRIVQESIRRMAAAAERNNINFVVALIPTKELVYAAVVKELGDYPVPTTYTHLVRAESIFWQRVKSDLDGNGIRWIDTLGSLRTALMDGEPVYSISSNGHPQAAGYHAIAREVAAAFDAD